MSTGKIKTLYSDREKTEPLYPRTKTSAISDDNGKGLDAILEELAANGTGEIDDSTLYILSSAGTAINSEEDLNNYTTPGIYGAVASVAQSLTNCPIAVGFKMTVEYNYTSNTRIIQKLYPGTLTNTIFYQRQFVNDAWSEWRRPLTNILLSSDYGTSLPTAGTAGRIFFKKVSS